MDDSASSSQATGDRGHRADGSDAVATIVFQRISAERGFDFFHAGHRGKGENIHDYFVGGIAILDYDSDGLPDIFMTNSPARSPEVDPLYALGSREIAEADMTASIRLYRNLGSMRFEDRTEEAGLLKTMHALGAIACDLNSDGLPDLFVTGYGRNACFLNCGDGRFQERTELLGLENEGKLGAGITAADFDSDGHLDLYVANYAKANLLTQPTRTHRGVPVYGPLDYPSEPDNLFLNSGSGRFQDASALSGVSVHAGNGMAVVSFDASGNHQPEVFVANDTEANYLFVKHADDNFEENGMLSGIAFSLEGKHQGNMGANVLDFDLDGDLDLISTNFQDEPPILYANQGQGLFIDRTTQSLLGKFARREVTWGVGVADFDNDQWPDLFVGCGSLTPLVEASGDRSSFRMKNRLARNCGDGTFRDVSADGGDACVQQQATRDIAVSDFDRDGLVDAVVFNLLSAAELLENQTDSRHGWIGMTLVGTQSNRDAVGAKATILGTPPDTVLRQQVLCGRGYQGHHGTELHFGLGDEFADRVMIEIEWPTGHSETFGPFAPNSYYTLVEGRGSTR